MIFLQTLHGHWRWVLAVLAIVIIVKYAIGLIQKSRYEGLDVTLGRVFAGAVTVQFVLGLINTVGKLAGVTGSMYRQAWEHVFTGVIITAFAHALVPMTRKRGYLIGLIITVLSLLLMVVNVISVRGGWLY
jgi:hypothetical protein